MALFQLVYNQFCTFSCLTHICMAVIGIREPRAMGHLVKTMVFPVDMYGHQNWTVKKAEHQRIDAFELWCWRRFLRVPWTARRSNQSILKEISPEYSMEGLMLKLILPKLWPPDVKNWLIWKDPDAGKGWRWEEKGTTEDEMAGWHHQFNKHEFE